jgi:hypothetical protein
MGDQWLLMGGGLAMIQIIRSKFLANSLRLCKILSLVTILLCPMITARDTMAIEEAKYTVIEKDGPFEVRQYGPQIVAETFVQGDFEKVGNEGFRRLYGYISGENRKKESISMTAPVSQEASSEKIAMTAPVGQERVGGTWRITFVMPSAYTMETLPEPLDSRVILREIPEQLMAAMRYSGTWGRERYEERKARLLEGIQDRGLRPTGEPVFARYNPPFMPWFLRRNEVLIPVERV